jgi:dTDP-4-amino-4,6-dideoxygalactose transaminase
MNRHGVQCHSSRPMTRQATRSEEFPNAHHDQGRILSLPMFAEMTRAQQQIVVDLIRAFG